ncbi:MAG: PorV/PorQ family protein [Candidatus Marinimicrobia bacterium]|nr:PorV/PorQ family protein [Candidatus Neomarinimicrobiota bacterium]MBL7030544.1 PorV/PorQ family protein [Candidatus Neomarinimicrobiota bacterium]
MRQLNKMKKIAAALLISLVLPGTLLVAQKDENANDKAGSVGFKFLNLSYGARGTALGGLAAQAEGPEAMFWNPAGLTNVTGIGITAGQTQWFVETSYNNFGFAMPLAGGVIGASILSVDYGDMMRSGWSGDDEFIFDANQGSFTASDRALQVSYAKNLSDKFSIGGTAKSVSETIDGISIGGMGFDIGTQFNVGYKNIRLGAVISNFGGDVTPVEVEEEPDVSLPMTFQFGIVGQAFGDANMGLIAGLNVTKFADAAQRFAFNGEMTVAGMAKIRGSYSLGNTQAPLSLGGGVKVAGISIDAAFTSTKDFGSVTQFSLGYSL